MGEVFPCHLKCTILELYVYLTSRVKKQLQVNIIIKMAYVYGLISDTQMIMVSLISLYTALWDQSTKLPKALF